MLHALDPSLGEVNSVRRKLFAVRTEIGGGKADLIPDGFAMHHRAENGVIAAQHFGGFGEISGLDGLPDRRAADDMAIHADRGNADDVEIETVAEFLEQIEIAGTILAKRPLMSDANFA